MKPSKTFKEKNMDLKHFVTFFYEQEKTKTFEVPSNEVSQLNIPEGVYGFKVFDRPSANIFKKGKVIIGINEMLNEMTYYIGKIFSLDDIKKTYGEDSQIYKKYIDNKFYGAVISPTDFLIPLKLNRPIHIITPEEIASFRSSHEQEIEAEA